MQAIMTHRGRTYKEVTITDAPEDVDRETLVTAALVAAREDRSSLFGTDVSGPMVDGSWLVRLHTD